MNQANKPEERYALALAENPLLYLSEKGLTGWLHATKYLSPQDVNVAYEGQKRQNPATELVIIEKITEEDGSVKQYRILEGSAK